MLCCLAGNEEAMDMLLTKGAEARSPRDLPSPSPDPSPSPSPSPSRNPSRNPSPNPSPNLSPNPSPNPNPSPQPEPEPKASARGPEGKTALMLAAAGGHCGAVKLLVTATKSKVSTTSHP